MASDNNLELVVEVDVNKANASIKSVNTGLFSMEQAAGKAARGTSAGIDGLTVSIVKGSAAGNLLADSIRKALDWAKEWTLGTREGCTVLRMSGYEFRTRGERSFSESQECPETCSITA